MKAYRCDQEDAVLEAVGSGHWPDAELRAHAAACPICADVALVAEVLEAENEWIEIEAPLPPAGLVWWKAQMRAKRDAAERAAAPIRLVERVAGIFGVVSLVILAILGRS